MISSPTSWPNANSPGRAGRRVCGRGGDRGRAVPFYPHNAGHHRGTRRGRGIRQERAVADPALHHPDPRHRARQAVGNLQSAGAAHSGDRSRCRRRVRRKDVSLFRGNRCLRCQPRAGQTGQMGERPDGRPDDHRPRLRRNRLRRYRCRRRRRDRGAESRRYRRCRSLFDLPLDRDDRVGAGGQLPARPLPDRELCRAGAVGGHEQDADRGVSRGGAADLGLRDGPAARHGGAKDRHGPGGDPPPQPGGG